MEQSGLVLENVSFKRPTFLRSSDSKYGKETVILDNLNLILQSSDRVGLMGLNGAGKTTLLQLMAGILQPTSGQIHVNGTIATMLTTSIGIKHDATGYENVKIMAILMGIPFEELPKVRKYVADFTDLGDKLNAPVKTYSNGMRTRLGFAVATYINPSILLVDEVISAGDDIFREKASRRIEEMMSSSGIVVLASHGIGVLRQFCNKALILEHGKVHFFGDIEDGVTEFRDLVNRRNKEKTP